MVDVTVSSPTQLLAALSNASGETTIRLLPGNYGFLNLQNMKFPAEVTIASADPGNPATFDRVQLLNVKQLAFDSIEFAYDSSPGASVDKVYFLIEDCKKIAIRNATFIGDLAEGVGNASDGYGAGIGLCVIDSKKITVEGNQFLDWWIAAQFLRSDKLTVKDNDIHDVRNDGLTFAEVNDVVIEGNHIHDFRVSPTSGDHPDMIQFWTAGSKAPSSEITIRGNTLDSGSGSETQSIFMGNEKASKGISMYYRDVLIEDNHINNSDWFGIYVGESIGTKIHDNVLTFNPAGGSSGRLDVPTIQISEDSKTTTVTANEVTGMDLRGGDKADVLEGGFGEDKLAGGDGKDVLLGDANDDVVKGGSGKDRVFGGSDSDRVKGGAGNDELDGGPGSDDLVGGAGGDLFVFSAADHSPAGDPDRILDFNRKEGDRIDLSDLDGNTSKAGDQDLVFIGSKAFDAYDREDAGSKGLVRFSDGRLTADVNGDNIADFEVSLGKANLHHGDLLL